MRFILFALTTTHLVLASDIAKLQAQIEQDYQNCKTNLGPSIEQGIFPKDHCEMLRDSGLHTLKLQTKTIEKAEKEKCKKTDWANLGTIDAASTQPKGESLQSFFDSCPNLASNRAAITKQYNAAYDVRRTAQGF